MRAGDFFPLPAEVMTKTLKKAFGEFFDLSTTNFADEGLGSGEAGVGFMMRPLYETLQASYPPAARTAKHDSEMFIRSVFTSHIAKPTRPSVRRPAKSSPC